MFVVMPTDAVAAKDAHDAVSELFAKEDDVAVNETEDVVAKDADNALMA